MRGAGGRWLGETPGATGGVTGGPLDPRTGGAGRKRWTPGAGWRDSAFPPELPRLTAPCVQDWDLKMEKGHCLNYLGDDTFDVSFPPPSSSSATQPKSVKRVHQIYEKPTFLESVSSAEVIQGSLGNCWAVAALSALADVDDGIKRLCVEYDTRKYERCESLRYGTNFCGD